MASGKNLNPNSILAKRVQQAAEERQMSLGSLAERAGLGTAEVDAVLSGNDAGILTLVKLAGALAVDLDWLLDGVQWVPGQGDGRGRFKFEEDDQD